MGEIAGWITTIASVMAAIAASATALLIWRQSQAQEEIELPSLFVWAKHRTEFGMELTIAASNVSNTMWKVLSIRSDDVATRLVQHIPTGDSGPDGNPEYRTTEPAVEISIDVSILPAHRAPNSIQCIASITPVTDGADAADAASFQMSARIESVRRSRRSSRQTATINITD